MAPTVNITKKPRSIVWKYFGPPDQSTPNCVKCPSCPSIFKFHGATTGLLNHLQIQHSEDYNKLLNKERDLEPSLDRSNALEVFASSFATGLIPFRFAENSEFRNFIHLLDPSFRIPNGQKVKKVIDKMAGDYSVKVRGELSGVVDYTILTDGYSDLKWNYNFYSLHIAFVDQACKRQTLFVNLKAVEKGDAVTIGAALNNSLKDHGLLFTDCSAVTSDAGSPLVLLAEKQGVDRVHCGCHALNLIIDDFSKELPVTRVQRRVQSFAAHLSRRKATKENLLSLSKQKGIKVPLPLPLAPTRWAGLHILLERYLANYEAIKDLSDLKQFLLKTKELEKVREIAELLKPIHTGILRLERDEPYASEILPTLVFIRKQVEKKSTSLSNKLRDHVDHRIKESLKNKRLISTMLIDHRYAYDPKWETWFLWAAAEIDISVYNTSPIITQKIVQPTEDDDDLDLFLDSSVSSQNVQSNIKSLETELIQYHSFLTASRPSGITPLEFWKAQSNNFPILYSIARKLLSSPASSSVSERTFSRCSDFTRQKKRNRAKLGTLNNLLQVSELSKLKRKEELNADVDDCSSDSGSDSDSEDVEMDDNKMPESMFSEDEEE